MTPSENNLLCLSLYVMLHPEGAKIFSENETYPRALLHWTRAAAQGSFIHPLSHIYLKFLFFTARFCFIFKILFMTILPYQLHMLKSSSKMMNDAHNL